jgi:hypothetical protein
MARAKKPKLGRPPLPGGRVPLNTTVPPHVKQWLLRNGGASVKITELVEAEIERQADETDQSADQERGP